MLRGIFFTVFLFVFSYLSAQKKDTIKSYKLEEVIISTGQSSPQSIKKSVYNVAIIRNKKIHHLAATSLEDVLRQSLNLNIIPDLSTGKTGFSLFGLDGEYVKVLVDNIPLTNDIGYGNNTDLSQINLQDVEQIEIVEGAMAVEYGTNAVTGVINIITKKRVSEKLKVVASITEETVGKEYELFNKGKHIQGVSVMGNLTDELFATFSYNRNDFAGYFKDRKGRYEHRYKDLRGHHWLPRIQHNTSFLLNFTPKKWRSFYKFSYMNDEIDDYNKLFKEDEDVTTGIKRPFANDKEYTTERYYHHLNLVRNTTKNSRLNLSLSYQLQERKRRDYIFYIKSKQEEDETITKESSMRVFSSVGSYNIVNDTKTFNARLGFDIGLKRALLNGLSLANSGDYEKNEKLNHYDFFGFSEYAFTPKFSFRTGIRGMFSEFFDTKVAYNASAKYTNHTWDLRFIFGVSPRNPNFTELFYSFVDINHNVKGNRNLKAEEAVSFNLNIKKRFEIDTEITNVFNLSGQFIDISDRITWLQGSKTNGQSVFTPENIDEYTSWSISVDNKLLYKDLEFSLGAICLGISQNLKSRVSKNDDFLYTLQVNSNVLYKLPKYGITFAAYYKYNGELTTFVYKDEQIEKAKQQSYNWLDASISKGFFNTKMQFVLGVRNITNTTQIQSSTIVAGNHSDVQNLREFGYGTSFFGKIIYNIFK